jgi:hypothetical protein
MSDEPFYSPTKKPAPARVAKPGELLFEFHVARTHRFYRVELRDHGPVYGVEAQFLDPIDPIHVPHVSCGPGPDADATRDGHRVGQGRAKGDGKRLERVINQPAQAARRDRIGLAIAGGVFVLLRLGSDYIPSPTRLQERTIVVALALAAGAAGGFVPGAIAVEGTRPSVAVRATGAIGLAVVIIILFYRFIA